METKKIRVMCPKGMYVGAKKKKTRGFYLDFFLYFSLIKKGFFKMNR